MIKELVKESERFNTNNPNLCSALRLAPADFASSNYY